MKNVFDSYAQHYDDYIPGHIINHYINRRLDLIRRFATQKSRILDIGCGTGNVAGPLSQKGYKVFGLDLSVGMLKKLRTKYPNIITKQGSVDNLPFKDNSFDIVYSIATFHHIVDKAKVSQSVNEMIRVVKPNGVVIIWDHNPNNPYWPFIINKLPWDKDVRLVDESEIKAAVAKTNSNSKVVKIFKLGFIPDFIPQMLLPIATRIERFVENLPLISQVSAHNVFIIRK